MYLLHEVDNYDCWTNHGVFDRAEDAKALVAGHWVPMSNGGFRTRTEDGSSTYYIGPVPLNPTTLKQARP